MSIASFEDNRMITLTLLAGISVSGLIFMLVEVRNAPHGYEDETGFHSADRNAEPSFDFRPRTRAIDIGI